MAREQQTVAPSQANVQVEARRTREAQEAVASGEAVPKGIRSVGLLVLSVLAVVYTLYFGKEIILPIALAVVLKLLLQPAMRLLHERLHVPQALSALLLILVVFGAIASVGFAVSLPASGWIQRAPESLPLLKEKLAVLRQPLDFLQQGLNELENVTSAASQDGGAQTVTVKQASGLGGSLASGTATMLSRFFTTMIMLFFLLASGDRLLRGFVEVLPRFSDKRQAVEIATEIQENITGYLLTITMMNAVVGVATGLAMWACGLGTPLLWGATAFLLNYIPILGPMAGLVIFFIAGVLSFGWPWYALIPAGIYLLIHVAEGETITPMLLAKRFTLNPVLVIISLFFWHTLWGIPGALLAVPLLAMMKIVADRVEPLKPVGHIIGA
ncbi:AI-2E family transporter [Microvirga lotononidis]|uniref:Putative permease n=1 Tax=Microvirga lotononidis TaxID=864069 RepID=I4Z2E6_9HYPH|nr:AI-2E family transporter [Microvirga lotononidis]EIM30388.1 putative permease [Microvirga lotononidis]WQO30889.1 AI-2E family transporter [Microvirga lotononidis]